MQHSVDVMTLLYLARDTGPGSNMKYLKSEIDTAYAVIRLAYIEMQVFSSSRVIKAAITVFTCVFSFLHTIHVICD